MTSLESRSSSDVNAMPPAPRLAKRAAAGTPSTASLYITLPVVVGLTLALAICIIMSRRSRRAGESRIPPSGETASVSPVSLCADDLTEMATPNAPPAAYTRPVPVHGPAYQDIVLDGSVSRGVEPPPYDAEPKPPRYIHGSPA